MTVVINKKTGAKYTSKVSTQKLHWMSMMQAENPEFFEGYSLGDFVFFPLDGGY